MTVLTGTDSLDLLQGGEGDDTIDALGGGDIVHGNGGNDVIHGGTGDDALYGEDGNDFIEDAWGYDIIYGGAGNDILRGGATDTYIYPGTWGVGPNPGSGSKVIDGGDGDDVIYGGFWNDALSGGAGNDTITTQAGAGSVSGQSGADVLRHLGPSSADMYLSYAQDPSGVSVDLYAGKAVDGWGDTDTLSGFHAVIGSNFDDVLIGGNRLSGAAGNDVIVGARGNGSFYGGTGSDVINDGDASQGSITGSTGTVYRLYRAALGREPDLGGLQAWSNAVDHGLAAESVAAQFLTSAEFQATYGALDNRAFVALLYRNVLHREPDAAGLASWVDSLGAGSSRASILLGFAQSAEFKLATSLDQGTFMTSKYSNEHQGQVYRLYQAALDRAPDYAGFASWFGMLDNNGGSVQDVAKSFVNSAEFRAKYGALSNTQFVTQLYANVLDRAPDAAGLAAWVGALDGGMSRADLLLGFSDSAEMRANAMVGFRTFMEQQYGLRDDWIEGGPDSDQLVGGAGADTFNFNQFDRILGNGAPIADHVYGFENIDTLRLGGYGFTNAAQVHSLMQQQGADVVLFLSGDASNTITFHNTSLATMSQAGILLADF